MFEVIACLLLHCLMSFIIKYCYDKETIWHNGEHAPNLHMPKLYDLDENCSMYDKQKYVEKVIIPASNYFSAVSDIEISQKNDASDIFVQLIAWASTSLLAVNAFRKTHIIPSTWLSIAIGIIICIVVTLIVSVIYNRTRLKLGMFKLSVSDIEKDFYRINEYCDWDFDISEENALNNFIIEKHYNYIQFIYVTIDKRYRIKKMIEAAMAVIYFLFFMEIPN